MIRLLTCAGIISLGLIGAASCDSSPRQKAREDFDKAAHEKIKTQDERAAEHKFKKTILSTSDGIDVVLYSVDGRDYLVFKGSNCIWVEQVPSR
jgi:hypothetical protein